ncbi:MAG: hypothetical protein AAF357_07280, partial [Verrucomicrobiota bacterium]
MIALVAIAMVAVVAFLVYLNRAKIVNDVLALYVEPYDVSVERIDLYPIGEVSIRNLQLSPKEAELEAPTLSVPKLSLSYDFQTLRETGQFKTVKLDTPIIRLNDETLSALSSSGEQQETASTPLDFSKFALFTESLSIEEGELRLSIDGFPKVSGIWSLNSPPFEFDESGDLSNPITLDFSSLQIGPVGGAEEIQSLSTGLRLSRNLTRFEIPYLKVSGADMTITPDWFQRSKPPVAPRGGSNGSKGLRPGPNLVEWILRDISLADSTFSVEGFDGSTGSQALPDMTFDTSFDIEELRFAGGRMTSPETVELEFTDVAIGSPNAQLASADAIRASASSIQAILEHRTFTSIDFDGIEVVMTDETLERCRVGKSETKGSDEASGEPGSPWVIEELKISDGRFVMREATFGAAEAPHLETAIAGTLSDLRFGGEAGFASRERSEFRLSNTRLWAPGIAAGVEPILSLDRAELAGVWADFDFNTQLERLAVRGPVIHFTDRALGYWASAPDETEEAGPVNRPVYKISDLEVTNGKLIADTQFAKGRIPKVFADFSIQTNTEPDSSNFDYKFMLENLQLRNHTVAAIETEPTADPTLFPGSTQSEIIPAVNETEVLSVRQIELSATADALQRSREIGKVRVSGAILRVGEGLKAITDAGNSEENENAPSNSEPESEEKSDLPTWMLKEVEITQSQIRFESLIPQITGLEFAIETKLSDVPLSPDGLLAQDEIQKVELAGIEIKDPYNSFITVAFLPTIFVEFSLAGLANQEIEKIDLIGPALHVGQGLFWWIDYQRKFREQNEGASVGIEGEDPVENPPDWEIKTINATAGKIVIAPTGIPIGMVPFPFNATTNMKDGRIELKLNIPDEEGYVYSFPDYEVDLYGLTGNIEFNVPIQQVSNNIVQVFELDRFIWKDYEAENLYLSVTFDENGVYGELGGEAYGGYAEGGFNFYLN